MHLKYLIHIQPFFKYFSPIHFYNIVKCIIQLAKINGNPYRPSMNTDKKVDYDTVRMQAFVCLCVSSNNLQAFL